MQSYLSINVRLIADKVSNPADVDLAGVYRVDFTAEACELSAPNAAAVALDVFRAIHAIARPDDFAVEVFDSNRVLVTPAPEHDEDTGTRLGAVEKVSHLPASDLVTPSGRRQHEPYERYTIEVKRGMEPYTVYGWGTYPRSSVLAGQAMKVFIDSYATREEAETAYPEAAPGSKYTDPQVSLNHLPDENDPVPGGMYPDDWSSDEPDWR